jgi:outer membrane receptor protein involved in Fe transport
MRRGIVALLFLLSSIAATGRPTASAQVPDTTQRRDTTRKPRPDSGVVLSRVEVRASIIPAAGPTIGSGVPARVTVLSRREIDAWEPRLLPDALGTQAGVSIYDDLGSPYKLNLSTRGFSAGPTVGLPPGISVFLDGVRQNEPDAQEVNFDLLPMEHVRRVELLSGTASLLGPNSLGGAVNLITDRGTGAPSGEIELAGGTFDAYSAEASASGLARGAWDYYLSGGYEQERGWRQATGAENFNGFVNLGRRGPERGLSLQAYGVDSRAETAGSLPERLFETAPRTNFTVGDFEDLDAAQVALSAYAPVGRGHGAFTAYFRRSHAERFNVNQAPDPDVRSLTTNYTLGGNADWRWAAPLGAGAIAARVGLDAAANRVRVKIFNEAPAGGDAGGEEPAGLTTDVRSPSWDLAGYALADWQRGRVTLSAGARYDHVRIPFRNRLRPEDRTTNSYDRLSPRGGVSVDVGGGASLYASVGGSFRAPAILELGCADPEAACPLPFALGEDPPLDPVTATTYEVGGRWSGGPVAFSGSAYRTDVRDEIFFVASEQALFAGFFTNLDRTRREGLELGAQASLLGDRVFGYANYAWTRATFRTGAELFSIRTEDEFADSPLAGGNDVEPGDLLPLVPEHQAKAGALVRLPRAFEVGVDARYVGRQWLRGDEANETEPLDGYVVANLRLGYSFRAWELSAVVTNLLDSHDAVFGTFNENRQTGELERFLTPLNARAVKLILRRELGGRRGEAE